jgi:hypothetical protein
MEIDWTDRFWRKVARTTWTECWIWMGAKKSDGYGSARIDGRWTGAHRCAYELANGHVPAGLHVRHKCDVPLCCNPAHLEVGTRADNMRDMTERCRQARGEASGRAKLTAAQVAEMRAKHAAGGCTQLSLAAEYGVSFQQVSLIVNGRLWSHLVDGT